ncbi:hypothetical protein QN277_023070 [Acacia crassicarpa]|uniref:Ubiquitin-like protease family profile domain-containing protein n=2 Tax=Acacia crassicarpa TaxID=499986 RepID=A0AAE1MLM2_9FABA|nr:hypothetical protein QN277_023070 [Acacia crassicarpa]
MGDLQSTCYLAPIHEGAHWTLCVVCPSKNACYWYDSISGRPTEDIKSMFAEALRTYRDLDGQRDQGGPKWFYPKCHQQPGNTECGYYVISWMQTIISNGKTTGFGNYWKTEEPYSQDDLDSTRDMLARYLLEHGSLAS